MTLKQLIELAQGNKVPMDAEIIIPGRDGEPQRVTLAARTIIRTSSAELVESWDTDKNGLPAIALEGNDAGMDGTFMAEVWENLQ